MRTRKKSHLDERLGSRSLGISPGRSDKSMSGECREGKKKEKERERKKGERSDEKKEIIR